MNKLFCVLPAALLGLGIAGATTAAAPLDKVLERGVLEVAAYREFAPFSYKGDDGRSYGVDVDVARALAARMGVAGAIRLVGADESMGDDLRINVWKGHYIAGQPADMMIHVPLEKGFAEEEDKVRFLAPYYREELMLAYDPQAGAPTIETFTTAKVGVELDTLADFYLLSALDGKVRENVVHFFNLREAGAAMQRGEVAAIFGPRVEVEHAVRDTGGRYQFKRLAIPGVSRTAWDVGVVVKGQFSALADEVDKVMAELHAEGVIERIFAKHGLSYVAPHSRRTSN